jgi:hypothetical protein
MIAALGLAARSSAARSTRHIGRRGEFDLTTVSSFARGVRQFTPYYLLIGSPSQCDRATSFVGAIYSHVNRGWPRSTGRRAGVSLQDDPGIFAPFSREAEPDAPSKPALHGRPPRPYHPIHNAFRHRRRRRGAGGSDRRERVVAGSVTPFRVTLQSNLKRPLSTNVHVSYHWLREDGSVVVWDGEAFAGAWRERVRREVGPCRIPGDRASR